MDISKRCKYRQFFSVNPLCKISLRRFSQWKSKKF